MRRVVITNIQWTNQNKSQVADYIFYGSYLNIYINLLDKSGISERSLEESRVHLDIWIEELVSY